MSTGSGSTSELAHEGAVPSEYHDRPSHAHPLKVVDGGCAAGGAVGVVVDVVGAGVVAVGAVGLDDDPPLHLDNASERKTTKTSNDRCTMICRSSTAIRGGWSPGNGSGKGSGRLTFI